MNSTNTNNHIPIPELEEEENNDTDQDLLRDLLANTTKEKIRISDQLHQLQELYNRAVEDSAKTIEEQQRQIADLRHQQHPYTNTQHNINDNHIIDYHGLYHTHRIIEFFNRERKILWNRMEPGYIKHGNGLFLGSCPWELLAFHFRKMQCEEKITKRKVRRQGKRVEIPFKWFIFNKRLPDLGGRWSGKYYKRGNEIHRSDYVSIAFIVNTADDRVYCNWKQRSYLILNGSLWHCLDQLNSSAIR